MLTTGLKYVSLTYDGSTIGHAEIVLPALDAFGFKGTFFIDPSEVLARPRVWREAHAAGHEIGNGGLLSEFSTHSDQLIRETNEFIFEFFGERCQSIAQRAFDQPLQNPVLFTRTGVEGINRIGSGLPIRALYCDNYSGPELIGFIEHVPPNSWLVFAFMGVGEGEPSIDLSAHQQLLSYLAQSPHQVATFCELARLRTLGAQERPLEEPEEDERASDGHQ